MNEDDMKMYALTICGLMLVVLGASAPARAQAGAVREPDQASLRDPVLEADSKKNLEAARLYFKLRKAYRASLARTEEIIAGNPNFSRIDETLYIAGMSHLYLSQKKGKQLPTLAPEKHLEEAKRYLSQLIEEYPESEFRKKTEEELKSIGGMKAENK
ncbi:MAG: outer membrane protein assembly factor BamD [Acidobacteriota bacterium]|nr:outer membrane protein assembly factor BamD [Acidobacteriota bacterium]